MLDIKFIRENPHAVHENILFNDTAATELPADALLDVLAS